MLKKYYEVSYNSNLFLAPYILKYGSLLNIDYLCDIQICNSVTHVKYTLCYDLSIIKKPKLLRHLRYLITLEPNYSNTYIQNGRYLISFNVPKQYNHLSLLKSNINRRMISNRETNSIITFRNNEAPSIKR